MVPELIQATLGQMERKRVRQILDQFIYGWGATTWSGAVLDPIGLSTWCCPARGSRAYERTGLKCTVVRIEFAGVVEQIGYTTAVSPRNPNVVELALVLDHQTNGAQLYGTDVFVQGTLPGMVDVDNESRYTVLKRLLFDFKDTIMTQKLDGTGYYISGSVKPFRFALDTNIELDFIPGAGTQTVADLMSNSLHVLGTALNNASTYIHARMNGLFFFYG